MVQRIDVLALGGDNKLVNIRQQLQLLILYLLEIEFNVNNFIIIGIEIWQIGISFIWFWNVRNVRTIYA